MKITKSVAALLVGGAMGASAQSTIYTSESAFVAALPSGYYLENFSSQTAFAGPLSSLSFSGGAPTVNYTITADPAGLFINNDSGLNAVGNYNSGNDVLVTFTSSNVYAAGAEFYLNNLAGANQNGSITINFSGGATGSAPSSATGSYGFFGINSTTPISSMTVVHDANYFINLANLYSGATPVPEPATGLVLLTGIAGLACARWRKLF